MRISELAEVTGVPVATLKYYLRDGLLNPGTALSRTRADYDESHVARVKLVRALTEQGGLSLSRVQRVLAALDMEGLDHLEAMEVAQRSLNTDDVAPTPFPPNWPIDGATGQVAELSRDYFPDSPAGTWLHERRWLINAADPLVAQFDAAWQACEDAELPLRDLQLDAFAEGCLVIAQGDIAVVPEEPSGVARQVILGTVLLDPMLSILRRLAQQHVAVSAVVAAMGGAAAAAADTAVEEPAP